MTSALWQLVATRFALAQVAVVAALFACAGVGMAEPLALAAVGAVTLLAARRLPAVFGIGLGVVAWAYFTGFVVNRYGQLTFADGDLARLGLLLACAGAAHWRR